MPEAGQGREQVVNWRTRPWRRYSLGGKLHEMKNIEGREKGQGKCQLQNAMCSTKCDKAAAERRGELVTARTGDKTEALRSERVCSAGRDEEEGEKGDGFRSSQTWPTYCVVTGTAKRAVGKVKYLQVLRTW